jgi:hypothetical protein
MSWFPAALEVLAAYDAGHRVGEVINETVVQPVLDHHQAGSGDLGAAYLDFINHHFDPMHPLDALHTATADDHNHHDSGHHDAQLDTYSDYDHHDVSAHDYSDYNN